MALTIRLRRTGSKARPYYRLVATDSRMPRDGRFIEVLGFYNPIEKPARLSFEEDRIFYWLDKGAETSDTVNSLFKQAGLLEKWDTKKKGEDVSAITLKPVIKERVKKRKVKQAK